MTAAQDVFFGSSSQPSPVDKANQSLAAAVLKGELPEGREMGEYIKDLVRNQGADPAMDREKLYSYLHCLYTDENLFLGAVEHGNIEAVKALKEVGADLNAQFFRDSSAHRIFGRTALMMAMELKDKAKAREMFDLLLDDPRTHVGLADEYGNTAMTYAIYAQDLYFIERLEERGSNIHQMTNRSNIDERRLSKDPRKKPLGRSTIAVAAGTGNLQVFNYFLSKGVKILPNPFESSLDGWNILDEAANGGNPEIFKTVFEALDKPAGTVKELLQGYRLKSLLEHCDSDKHLPIAKFIVEKGLLPDDARQRQHQVDKALGDALEHAARNNFTGKYEMLSFLLDELGADLKSVTQNTFWDKTALNVAAHEKNLPLFKFLLEKGADPKEKNSKYHDREERNARAEIIHSYLYGLESWSRDENGTKRKQQIEALTGMAKLLKFDLQKAAKAVYEK